MSIMSVGASILGYADPEVDEKVLKAIKDGASSSLNCSEEVLPQKPCLTCIHGLTWLGTAEAVVRQ